MQYELDSLDVDIRDATEESLNCMANNLLNYEKDSAETNVNAVCNSKS